MRWLFNWRLLLLGVALVTAMGLGAIQTLPRAEDPTIRARNATVTTLYPGADATRVEALVTEPIEEALRTLDEVDEVASTSRAGVSIVQITLRDEIVDVDRVWSRVRDELGDVEPVLPDGVRTPDLDDESAYAYTVLAALRWTASSPPDRIVLQRYAEALAERLRSVPGTDYVEVHGDVAERVEIVVDADALRAAGLALGDVAAALEGADARPSAGVVASATASLTVEVAGAFDGLDRLREVPLAAGDGTTLRLADVATIARATADPPPETALVDGEPAVLVGTRMREGERVDRWVPQAIAAIDAFAGRDVAGIAVEVVFEQARYTEERLASVVTSLIQGLVVVVAVLVLTMGPRAALAVGLAIPLTALLTIGLFPLMGIAVHQMSLVGLIVALGLMVDNAIIVTNDIREGLAKGERHAEAVRHAMRKLFWPLAASTLTTVLAFMPIVLLPGPAGEFVGPLALAVVLALLSSFAVSMLFVPALSRRLFREGAAGRGFFANGVSVPWLGRAFRRFLGLFLRRPVAGLAAALALPVLGVGAMPTVATVFFPPADRDQFRIEMRLAQSSSIEAATEAARALGRALRGIDGVTGTITSVGAAAPKLYYNVLATEASNPAYAEVIVDTEDAAATKRLLPLVQAEMARRFPAASVLAIRYDFGPPVPAPIEIRIVGPDLDTLARLGQEAAGLLANVPGAVRARAAVHRDAVKLVVEADEDALRRAGYDLAGLARQTNAARDGAAGGFLLEGTERLPATVRLGAGARASASDLASFALVPGSEAAGTGLPGLPGLPLGAVAEIRAEPAWVDIARLDGERIQSVSAFVEADTLPSEVLDRFRAALDEAGFAMPAGYRIEWGGEADARSDAIGKLLAQVGILLVLAVALIALVFDSFRRTAIVFGAGAMALGVALLVLKISGFPFGFLIVVGAMGLIGVGLNDTIVVIAAFDEDERARSGDVEAMLDILSGPTARHIWSTTITTAAGFVPLILIGGLFWPPFATVFAGGLLGLTVLAFVYAPAAYRLLCTPRR
ncbi:MAG: efflux RND transporter permease subunit [Paracoccaceae bacterium]